MGQFDQRPFLTVFTPTYNRAHLLPRVYESLCCQSCQDFEWLVIDDGSTDATRELVQGWINEGRIRIQYHWKENGGLYTGYNAAYKLAEGELCVCIDSDDWMPADAVEIIRNTWMNAPRRHGEIHHGGTEVTEDKAQPMQTIDIHHGDTEGNRTQTIRNNEEQLDNGSVSPCLRGEEKTNSVSPCLRGEYAGIVGLDFDARTGEPIGGEFPEGLDEVYFYDIHLKGLHRGDTKEVLRTDLMRSVAPMVGFPGERNFNPVYLMLQATERLPLLVVNRNLCNVEYQEPGDSMSANIFGQYVNSPRSFAKLRCLEIGYSRNSWRNRLRCYAHLASHCWMARDFSFRKQVPSQMLFWMSLAPGYLIYKYVLRKAKK